MSNVYEIAQGFDTLWELIEDETIEEAVLEDAFANLTDDLKDKFENCCKYIKNLDSDIAGLKEEEKRIKAKRQTLENGKERLKFLMLRAQKASGEKKLQCGSFTTTLQANPEKVVMDEQYIENIPEEYLKYKDPEIDKVKLKEHLKAGVAPEGIAHLEQDIGLRIR